MKNLESANCRAWKRQRENPTPCRYGCGANLVFLKNEIGQTIACEAREMKFNSQSPVSVMLEDGSISTQGERVGWLVHKCVKIQTAKEEEDVSLLETDALKNNSALNFLNG